MGMNKQEIEAGIVWTRSDTGVTSLLISAVGNNATTTTARQSARLPLSVSSGSQCMYIRRIAGAMYGGGASRAAQKDPAQPLTHVAAWRGAGTCRDMRTLARTRGQTGASPATYMHWSATRPPRVRCSRSRSHGCLNLYLPPQPYSPRRWRPRCLYASSRRV